MWIFFHIGEKTDAQKDFHNDLHKQEKLMKRFSSLILIALGIIIVFAGFVYDVLFAGIPYQDPTPALAASYNFHSQIASIIRWSGIGICIIGGILLVIRWLTIGYAWFDMDDPVRIRRDKAFNDLINDPPSEDTDEPT